MLTAENPIALAVNLFEQSSEQAERFLESLKLAIRSHSQRFGRTKLVYAIGKNDAPIDTLIAHKFSDSFQPISMETACANQAIVANRLMKTCFDELQARACILLEPKDFLLDDCIAGLCDLHQECPDALIGAQRCEETLVRKLASSGSLEQVDWLSGTCLLVPQSIYKLEGGFSCILEYDLAVIDLCSRAKAAGFDIRLSNERPLALLATSRLAGEDSDDSPIQNTGLERKSVLQSSNGNRYDTFERNAPSTQHNSELLLNEYETLRSELNQFHRDLRRLSPSFLEMSKLVRRLPVRRLKKWLAASYKSIWVRSLLAFPATLAAWIFFRIRLPSLFYFITTQEVTSLSECKTRPASIHNKTIRELASSGLFDVHYYLAQAPEAKDHELGPIGHYLTVGRHLNPHRLFDAEHYLSANARLACPKDMAPLLHYARSTGKEAFSPHPLFDARFYIESSPYGKDYFDKRNPLRHYLKVGSKERLDPHPLFSTAFYLNSYKEARQSQLTALEHFLLWGHTGKHSPNEMFDCEYYLRQNPHLKFAMANPLLHYVRLDNRNSVKPHALFDAKHYLSQLPMKEQALASAKPLEHFLHSNTSRECSTHPLFDANYYLEQAPYLSESDLKFVIHYLRYGESALLCPNKMFHTAWYSARHPELKANGTGLLSHYAETSSVTDDAPHPLFNPAFYRKENHPDSDLNLDALETYLTSDDFTRRREKTTERPMLGRTENNAKIETSFTADAAYQRLLELTAQPFSHLFLMPGLVKGGGERAACNYIQYLQEIHGMDQVLILLTEYRENTCLDWLPEGSRYVDIVRLDDLPLDQRGLVITSLIYEKEPKTVYCSNSYSFLFASSRYRDLIEKKTRFVTFLFGYEAYKDEGPAPITATPYKDTAGWFDCIITDNKNLASLVVRSLPERQLPGKVTACVYNSSLNLDNLLLENGKPTTRKGKQVLWASRLVDVKRPDLMVAIARSLPNIKFMVYGSAETGAADDTENYLKLISETPNIQYRGEYPSFNAIEKSEVGVFLYTSASDGVPIVLMEAAACGLPIIAPNIGGIAEFISNDTGWLIEKSDDIQSYVDALRFALDNPQEAQRKALRAQDLLRIQHSQESIRIQLNELRDFF